MIYKCKCDKCGRITEVDTEVDVISINSYGLTYVTCYNWLTTPCEYKDCKGDAWAKWRGSNGEIEYCCP